MFNAPRSRNAPSGTSTFTSSPPFDPLASSTPSFPSEAEVDPWSGAPSPSGTPAPASAGGMAASTPNLVGGRPVQGLGRMDSGFGGGGMMSPGGGIGGVLGGVRSIFSQSSSETLPESSIPTQYIMYHDSLQTDPTSPLTLTSLNRLLSTSSLPALINERIVNLVIPPNSNTLNASHVSREQFFVVMGLVGLAQGGKEISMERLMQSLGSGSGLPIPSLRMPSGAVGTPSLKPLQHPTPIRAYSQTSSNGFGGITPTGNTYKDSSPWDLPSQASRSQLGGTAEEPAYNPSAAGEGSGEVNGYNVNGNGDASADFNDFGAEARRGWWKELETVEVSILPEKEGWFLQKYRLESNKRSHGTVTRRYSDFVWLLDCISKRYPFRMLPSLPPKRIGPDASFLEQRRKGLQRFINFVVNHPVLREDGCLTVFLAEPNFEGWRKRSKVNLDEESSQKKLDPSQEMRIPSDLDAKIESMKKNLALLVESHAKLVVYAEKGVKRMESASADQARIAMTLATLSEACPQSCWRNGGDGTGAGGLGGAACELCKGVGRGLGVVGDTWGREAEEGERRAKGLTLGSIEVLKTQRDLYGAFRELLARYDRLSRDNVDYLRKTVDVKQKKLDSVRNKRKPNWELEEEKLISAIDQDNTAISSALTRRVYNRHCIWHELSIVVHSRQAAQATLGWRAFALEKAEALSAGGGLWKGLAGRLEDMPVE